MSKILNGREFLAQLVADNLTQEDFQIRFSGDECDTLWLTRGLCFDSKEAAIANAKAMCGINPEE